MGIGVVPALSMINAKVAKTSTRYRDHFGPSGPKLQVESENEFLGLPALVYTKQMDAEGLGANCC